MLAVLDRHVRLWHLWAANGVAIAWFVGIVIATNLHIPEVRLVRCPIGLCLGHYTPDELRAALGRIDDNGHEFLADILLPLDTLLPALLLVAFTVTYVWFTGPDRHGIPLKPGYRYALLAVPILYCVADYCENWAIATVLRAYPHIPDQLAETASFLTAAKSQLVVLSAGIAVALAIAAWSPRART